MHDCKKHIRKDFRAAECDDQLEFAARVGRGVKGDSFKVEVTDDEVGQAFTQLHGYTFDETAKNWIKVWDSENVNGGRLYVSEKINITDNPKTFTLNFIYERPGRTSWSLTTPAIPYLYDHPRRGSDVADVMLMDHTKCSDLGKCDMWKDPLVYDQDLPREKFNAPNPPGGKDKVSDTPVEHKGDVWGVFLDVAEFNELAKILGWTYEDLVKSINIETGRFTKPLKGTGEYSDVSADTVLEFIQSIVLKEKREREDEIQELREKIGRYEKIITAIVNKVYGTNTIDFKKGTITWENSGDEWKIPLGNINVYGWPEDNPNKGGLIQTHLYGNGVDDHPGDIKAK